MSVFVLDRRGRSLMPCSEKRARLLLARGRARVHRVVPFVIRLVDRHVETSASQLLRVKLDPGSRTTGMALVRDFQIVELGTRESKRGAVVLSLFELVHRGRQISEALTARRAMRRRRRGTVRYRPSRFSNRTRPAGWLPPSLQHRVDTTSAWVRRMQRWAPVRTISSELARFDMQALENPDIEGIEYQQGTLAGYEVREYLLEKWRRQCAYCDAVGTPLQIEHIHPKARGGSNRVSNLTLACKACNRAKGASPVEVFLAKEPKRLSRILAQAKRPLKDAAIMNATRWVLTEALKATGLPVELASGGRTKFNRTMLGVPKTHALDAACVGNVSLVIAWQKATEQVKCTGRGSYQRTRLDRYGLPRGYLTRKKQHYGFQTGDMVRATVPGGKRAGRYSGRVAVRASGNFNIQGAGSVVQGISHRYCRLVQRSDGYAYSRIATPEGVAETGAASRSALSLPAMNGGVSRAI